MKLFEFFCPNQSWVKHFLKKLPDQKSISAFGRQASILKDEAGLCFLRFFEFAEIDWVRFYQNSLAAFLNYMIIQGIVFPSIIRTDLHKETEIRFANKFKCLVD